ncbi:MAG: hypothetical protein QOH72_5508 [Solirubrobacteraceae bacterium]|jgi:hypothetical protein|nr:hypothetical protein [Solirubrobacteraceae bacterium]
MTREQFEAHSDAIVEGVCAERRARIAASAATDQSAVRAASGVPTVRTGPTRPALAEEGTGWFYFSEAKPGIPVQAAAARPAEPVDDGDWLFPRRPGSLFGA